MESIESEFTSTLSLREKTDETVNEKCKAKFSSRNPKIFENINHPVKLISNILKCSSTDLPKNLKIYGISAKNLENPEIIIETRDIKKIVINLKNIPQFQEMMKDFFTSYQISGNTLFGETSNTENLEDYYIYLKSSENNLEFLKMSRDQILSFQTQEENALITEKIKHYEISFQFSFPINQIHNSVFLKKLLSKEKDNYEKFKNSIITYCNIKTKDTLKFLGYKRYDYTRNYAYFKDINDNLRNNKNNYFYLQNRNSSDVIMIPGVNLTYNFYSNGNFMLRSITKYKMLREDTYLDLFHMLKSNKKRFAELVIGRFGFKIYKTKASEKFKIDDVVFLHPSQIPFQNPNAEKDGIITIYDYYKKNYPHLKIEEVEQPILINIQKRKNRFTGTETEIRNYLFAKFSYILGKFDTDQIDLKPLTSLSAQDKFAQICEPLLDLESYRKHLMLPETKKKKNINDPNAKNLQLSLREFKAYILKNPELQTNNREIISLGKNKRLRIEEIKAFKGNNNLGNWMLLSFGVNENESQNRFYNNLKSASAALGIEIDIPIVFCFESHKIKSNLDKNNIPKSFVENIFYDINKQNDDQQDDKKLELLVTILSEDFNDKNFYDLVKNSNIRSGLCLPSQNINYSKLLKIKNLSYFTSLLIQMFAKLSKPLWRFKSPKELDNTVIMSYSVKRDKAQKKTLAYLSVTIDKYFNDFIFVGEYSNDDSNIFFPNISKLCEKALKKLFKHQQINNEKENYFVENLIILREGVNESQKSLILKTEITDENLKTIKNLLKKRTNNKTAPEPKIMVIFINDRNDTKIFKNETENRNLSSSGIENYLQTGNQNDIATVNYADVGTLVDHSSGITLSDKEYEFYINSAFPTIGGSNFTKYSIVFDDTNLNEIIYALMYNLCFMYFNNPQPIKMPAPLYYVIRMNNYVIEHLGYIPERMDLTNFAL